MEQHWKNPWRVILVPIEELAACHGGLGQMYGNVDGSSAILTKEEVLRHWRTAGDKLDAYILPQPSGDHCIGIRYGDDGPDYLSPYGDRDKVAALLKRHL